jgi:epoxide hydrolase-like predicted phosphatase
MTLESGKVKAVIFDLGGVIVDLAVDKTIQAFSNLSGRSVTEVQYLYSQHLGFVAYEKGKMTDQDFRQMLRELFSTQVSDAQLDAAWNAMLVDLPLQKLQWLTELKKNFQIYALSNTNHIHINYVNEVMLKGEPLDNYFHRCYYSHHVHMRKPDVEIYEYVLSHAGLVPHEALFLDDNPDNIKTAKALGIQAVQVNHPDEVYTLVKWL